MTNITGKKLDTIHILKTLKLFVYDIHVNLEKKEFFIQFHSFINIQNKEDAIEEIIRIISYDIFPVESLKENNKNYSIRKELSDHLIYSEIKEVNTLPFIKQEGYLLSNPINKKNPYIRKTLFFNLKNSKKSIFEISSVFNEYKEKIFSYQVVAIYEIYPGIISNRILFNLLFYISSNKKSFFQKN